MLAKITSKVIKRLLVISKMPLKLNKQNVMDEEMEEIRRSLSFLSEELSKVSKQQTKLIELMDEVKHLKTIIKEKDKKINNLEKRIENLEQYTRMEDLVVTKHMPGRQLSQTKVRTPPTASYKLQSNKSSSSSRAETYPSQGITSQHVTHYPEKTADQSL